MHLTLKKEATKPASFNFLQQQERFDRFTGVYNHERPHQALGGAYPGDLYTSLPRAYEPPDEPEYPFHDRSVRVTQCGRICMGRRKINLSTVFRAGSEPLRAPESVNHVPGMICKPCARNGPAKTWRPRHDSNVRHPV